VRLSHGLAKIHASFDDPNPVSRAGLLPVMALAQRAGLGRLAGEHARIARRCGVNASAKVGCLVAGMIGGADSIDDLDLLRHGAMARLSGGIRAPSTLGSFLRSFTWNVRQLEKVGRLLRADSAFYSAAFASAVRATGAFFSVTVQMNPHARAAIAAIAEDAWTVIKYPRAIWDDQLACWVSDAQVAEVKYTAFTSTDRPVTARLIVRRVKDLNRNPADGQDELFPAWRHHAVFTDSPFILLQAEEQHRDHAQVEQVLADWTDGPLAHLPYVGVRRQRGLADLRCHQPQPAARRRIPGQPRLHQSPRRHLAARPHPRCRPRRPPQPRRNHPAPARGLAPRARMDQPPQSHHRTASPPGLTSPDPVTAAPPPAAPAGTSPDPGKLTDEPHKGERQENHAHRHPQDQFTYPGSPKRPPGIHVVDRG
jgi:hypothetical protein